MAIGANLKDTTITKTEGKPNTSFVWFRHACAPGVEPIAIDVDG